MAVPADHHAAALVRDIRPPAADVEPLAFDHGGPGRAGAEDQDGAVATAEGAEPGRIGVGVDRQAGEGMRPVEHRLPVGILLRAGKAETGMDAAEVGFGKPGRGDRLAARLHHFLEGRLAQPRVAGARLPFAEQAAGAIAKPRPAAAAAAVNTDEESFRHPRRASLAHRRL